jgi:two-component system phosphate regulon sensor histidine kinase PhoR
MISALIGALVLYIFYLHRKMHKAALKLESHIKQRAKLLDLLLEGVVILDEEGLYMNSIAKKFFGPSFEKETALTFHAKQILSSCKENRRPMSDSLRVEEGDKKSFDLLAIPYEKAIFLLLQDTSSQQKVLEIGRDFIANASHELKTPITIIRGFAEMLQEGEDFPREMVQEIIEKIVRNCKRMDSLVRNLLTLADIENVPLSHLQQCDLVALVEESKRSILTVYPDAKVDISSPSEVSAYVDPSILELAILNVLDNAIKYSKGPAHVQVDLKVESDGTKISIKDTGVGISERDLEHIFDRFYTVNKAHSRKLGGAGLGLSLVKTIIEKHEGTLHVTSAVGKGSVFTFSLPHSF